MVYQKTYFLNSFGCICYVSGVLMISYDIDIGYEHTSLKRKPQFIMVYTHSKEPYRLLTTIDRNLVQRTLHDYSSSC